MFTNYLFLLQTLPNFFASSDLSAKCQSKTLGTPIFPWWPKYWPGFVRGEFIRCNGNRSPGHLICRFDPNIEVNVRIDSETDRVAFIRTVAQILVSGVK